LEIKLKIAKQIENRIRELYDRHGNVEATVIRKLLARHIGVLGESTIENIFLYLFTKYGKN